MILRRLPTTAIQLACELSPSVLHAPPQFDEDDNGKLDIQEFIRAMGVLNPSMNNMGSHVDDDYVPDSDAEDW